jgi:hypothetical protein
MVVRFDNFQVILSAVLLLYIPMAHPTSPSPNPFTGVDEQVYLGLGVGPVQWVKFSCPISREGLTTCDATAVIQAESICVKFFWKSSETVPWDWPNRIRPNSNFLTMLEPALKENFYLVEQHKNAKNSIKKLSFFRPKDTVAFFKPHFPDFMEMEGLGNHDNSLPIVQHLVRAEDADMLRFSSISDRACIGNVSRTLKINPSKPS